MVFINVFECALEFKSLSADNVNANALNLEPDKPMFSKAKRIIWCESTRWDQSRSARHVTITWVL